MVETLRVGPIGVNVIIYSTDGKTCAIVDPGDDAPRIAGALDRLGLQAACIALTHGHLDHTGAIPALVAELARRGQKPVLAIHSKDAAYLGARAEATNLAVFKAIRATQYFKHYYLPLPEADLLLEDGDALPGVPALKLIHTPGHSAGSSCFYDAASGVLLSGDTLFSGGLGRTDCPDSDAELIERSIVERLLVLPPDTLVYPGHGEPTTIGAESRWFKG